MVFPLESGLAGWGLGIDWACADLIVALAES